MDPVSAAGLAISVASIGLQVYTGCVQGIQLLITARNFPDHCKYLNLRLRMEQQRLFAWSETSGLLDLDAEKREKILESKTFTLHRQTVLDLLVQVDCLFKNFREQQQRYHKLQTTPEQDGVLAEPEKDAAAANFPLPEKRGAFIKKAMSALRTKSKDACLRLRWVSFDKEAFELVLSRFSTLNDSMTDILDARLQVEIHHSVQDTNRGVLQLHHKIDDLSRLVMALNVKLDDAGLSLALSSAAQRAANASGLELLSQLAKFKAFNEAIESDRKKPWDEGSAVHLSLGRPDEQEMLMLDHSTITIDPGADEADLSRSEGYLRLQGIRKRIWIEWKEYDNGQQPGSLSPTKEVILERVRKLAALLNHEPKPEAFRTPHCLGFFDKAGPDDGGERDMVDLRLGLVFERPPHVHADLPPVSLRELLRTTRRPRVTDRVKLGHGIANCLLYLHAVNWLHKGLRSHNIVFFPTAEGHVDYAKPYLSGFDFSRPARPEEMVSRFSFLLGLVVTLTWQTDVPGDDAEFNMYRHPRAQATTYSGDRTRFRKSFDIYSLGVLLVELAHWTTVDKVLGIDLKAVRGRPSVILKVREALLTPERVEHVGALMGQVYEDASKKCIAGGAGLGLGPADDENDDAVAARLSMAFYEDVVKALGDVRV